MTYADEPNVNWPSFRGPSASGVAEGHPLPSQWNAPEGENVLWKTPIPGLGHASPVIWGDKVFIVTAVSGKADAGLKVGLYGNITPVEDDSVHEWLILCLDRKSGEVLWKETAHRGPPRIKRHTKATHANSTPATDGKYIVTFLGSEGLFCYDVDGKLVWKRDLGVLDAGYFRVPAAQWGFAGSPVIHGDKVIVQCDVQKDSFIAALRLKDGETIWRTPRDEVPTWSTPAVHVTDGRAQVIVNGYKHIGGYDLETGKELWKMQGGGDIPVPTPIIAHNLIYITNAHGRLAPLYAIRPSAEGDISLADGETSNKHIAWTDPRSGAYMQTPLVYGGHLYSCRDNGVLMCYDAKTGELLNRKRLGDGRGGFTASAVAGENKLYYTGEQGDVYVIRPTPELEVLAVNPLGEIAMPTPAISQGVLYFRTKGHVVAIGDAKK